MGGELTTAMLAELIGFLVSALFGRRPRPLAFWLSIPCASPVQPAPGLVCGPWRCRAPPLAPPFPASCHPFCLPTIGHLRSLPNFPAPNPAAPLTAVCVAMSAAAGLLSCCPAGQMHRADRWLMRARVGAYRASRPQR